MDLHSCSRHLHGVSLDKHGRADAGALPVERCLAPQKQVHLTLEDRALAVFIVTQISKPASVQSLLQRTLR
jgi:hypothetical protein